MDLSKSKEDLIPRRKRSKAFHLDDEFDDLIEVSS